MIGPVSIRPSVVWRVALDSLVPGWLSPTWQPFEASIVWDVRLPRVLLATIVGAGLAVVGAALQALLRNPLADPYLLGTSAGAALGAVGVLLFGASVLGALSVSAAAFAGALAGDGCRLRAGLAVRPVSYRPPGAQWRGGVVPVLVDDESAHLPRAERRTGEDRAVLDARRPGRARDGSRSGFRRPSFWSARRVLMTHSRTLNILSLGEEAAATLGVEARSTSADRVSSSTSLTTGVLVALSGGIGFVGLMVPTSSASRSAPTTGVCCRCPPSSERSS